MREIKLQDLKVKTPTELLTFAEGVEVENASTMRKQELMFAILKQLAAKETEILGEGYPAIADIPTVDANWKPGEGLAASGAEIAVIQAAFAADARAQAPAAGAAEIAAVVAAIQGVFEPGLPPGEFLTQTEIAAIRASFTVPRVTEGVITP